MHAFNLPLHVGPFHSSWHLHIGVPLLSLQAPFIHPRSTSSQGDFWAVIDTMLKGLFTPEIYYVIAIAM